MADQALTHIDIFSGPGGFCTGLRAAGFRTLAAVEKVDDCVNTYRANHPGVTVIHGDVREVQPADLKVDGPVTLLTAGFPCETFSTAGTKSRQNYDHRQFLFEEAVRLAKAVEAECVLFENVPSLQTKKAFKDQDGLVIDLIRGALREAGYANQIEAVINAADLGLPQGRRRFFLLGCRNAEVKLAHPMSDGHPKYHRANCRDALRGLPAKVHAGLPAEHNAEYAKQTLSPYSGLLFDHVFWHLPEQKGVTHHVRPGHKPTTVERYGYIPQGKRLADLYKTLPREKVDDLIARKVFPKVPFNQRGQRLDPKGISPTVTSHCLDELVHPTEDRCLTVRECARLQSFPDAYRFCGALSNPHDSPHQDMYEQIGDAVPPLVAFHWGEVIKGIICGRY